MRPGIQTKRLDTNLRLPDDHLITDDSTPVPAFGHGIGIAFESSLKETTFRVFLSNPTVYVLTVGMQDLLDWVISGFGFSTMRRSDHL